MANIKVKIDYPIGDGAKLKFRTPCESTSVEGLVVTYPVKDGVGYAVKSFTFVDAHGTELSGVGNVFTSDVMIEVLLDVTHGKAYIKNADTNSYIEDIKKTVERMDNERQAIFADAGRSIEECKDATKKAVDAANGVVTIEQNSQEALRFWVGTTEEYEAQKDNISANTFCILTDDITDRELGEKIDKANEDIEKIIESTTQIEENKVAIEENKVSIEENKEDIERLDSEKAPAGYGLGDNAYGVESNDLNDAIKCGWYAFTTSTLNRPFDYGTIMTVNRYGNQITQIAFNPNMGGCGEMCVRHFNNGIWSEWEYENPPMKPNTEYRTTKRHGGKAVYVKRIIHTFEASLQANLRKITLVEGITELVSTKLNYVKDDDNNLIPLYATNDIEDLSLATGSISRAFACIHLGEDKIELTAGNMGKWIDPENTSDCTISLDLEYIKD